MKVHTKVLFLLYILVGLFAAELAWVRNLELENVGVVLTSRDIEVAQMFYRLIETAGDSLRIFSRDYSHLDEMGAFVGSGDESWAREHLAPALSTYDAQAVWVFKGDFSRAYFATAIPDNSLIDLPLDPGELGKAFSRKDEVHFYAKTKAGVMEVAGAAIHGRAGADGETGMEGYLLAGRLWDESRLAGLAKLGRASLSINTNPGDYRPQTGHTDSTGVLSLSYYMLGWDGKPVARLDARISAPLVGKFIESTNLIYALMAVLALSLVLLLTWMLLRLVTVPLRSISSYLEDEDPRHLKTIEKQKSEFAHIASLIVKSLEQKHSLEQEITHRSKAEAQLKDANERHRTELIIAAELQLKMVPPLPKKGGLFLVEGVYRPSELLGGDYYDYTTGASGAEHLFIADFSGHGTASSLFCSAAAVLFKQVDLYKESPRTFFKMLNLEFLKLAQDSGRFLTAIYASAAPGKGVVRFLNAGHPPGYIVGREGIRARIESTGTPLGLFDTAFWIEEEYAVHEDEVILLYTDGLVESKAVSGDLPGQEWLENAIKRYCQSKDQKPLSGLHGYIVSLVDEKAKKLDDDLTILTIRVNTL